MANSSRADPMQPKEGAPQPALPPLPSAARIQLYEVLNGETDPPFTFPAFVAYLNKQHAEGESSGVSGRTPADPCLATENIEFYDAVVQYRKAARQLSHRIAQQQQQREASAAAAAAAALTSGQCAEPSPSSGSSSPTTAPQIPGNHGGKNSRRRRSSVFVSIAEMESQPILQSLASGISGRRGSIGFQNTMLFDSSLAALPNGSELKALLELQEGGSEGEDARILTERLGKLREKLERIVEIFLNEVG